MARTRIFTISALGVAFLAVVGVWLVDVELPSRQDLPVREFSPLASLLFPHCTEYSSRFSETAFQAIVPGMTTDAARALLGDPLEIIESHRGRVVRITRRAEENDEVSHPDLAEGGGATPDEINLHFSRPSSGFDSWHARAVLTDANGLVLSTFAEFYTD